MSPRRRQRFEHIRRHRGQRLELAHLRAKRALNKAAFRQRILDAAYRLFQEHGFRETTLQAIATVAGTGVATIYKHFQSKEDIFHGLIVPEIDQCFDQAEAIVANPPADPVVALKRLLACYFELGRNRFRKPLLSAFSVPGLAGAWNILDEVARETDIHARQLVRDLLLVFQASGAIPGSLNVEQMATIVYSMFNQKYLEYLTDEEATKEPVLREIRQLIDLLFVNWRTPGQPRMASRAAHTSEPGRTRPVR